VIKDAPAFSRQRFNMSYGTRRDEEQEVLMMSSEAEAHPNRFDSADSFESEGRTTGSRLSVYGLSVAAIGSVGILAMLAFGGATDKGAVNGAATNLARSDVQQQNIYVIPVPQSPAVSGINHETESAETAMEKFMKMGNSARATKGTGVAPGLDMDEIDELQMTPFGPFPKDCVHVLRDDGLLRETDTGVDILHKITGEVLESHAKLEKCTPYQKQVVTSRQNKRLSIKGIASDIATPGGGTTASSDSGLFGSSSSPTTLTSELDGWVDYVGFWPKQTVTSFNGTYTVPGDPKSKDTDQVLFYFIGLENIEETEAENQGPGSLESTITILQPVLTWGNTEEGWSMASWNCCPTGQTWMSSSITDLKAGDQLNAEISVGEQYSTVSSTLLDKKGLVLETAALSVDTSDREFDWMDVTLEVYSLTECEEFASSSMNITNMVAKGDNDMDIRMDWSDNSGSTDCNGDMQYDETMWSSSHTGVGPI